MKKNNNEFQEIAHCGGQFTINVKTNEDGRRGIQFGMRHSRPTPMALFGIYVLPQGIPVGTIQLGGIGDPWNPAPTADSLPVFISSDSHGMFGHQCPQCKGYWRSKGAPSRWRMTCAYCGLRAETHHFITDGQMKYIEACCGLVQQAMISEKDGEFVINMDEVADAAVKKTKKPKFYYAEESQQNKFNCEACGSLNDILGRFGYCSSCGSHNGKIEIDIEIKKINERIKTGNQFEACAKDAVAAFDSYARQIAKQFVNRIPMTPSRKNHWKRKLFHNLKSCANDIQAVFDIDIFKNIKKGDIDFAILMFHRRHVYEHNGGEVDEKYIRDSGDKSVRPKQLISESSDSAFRISSIVLKMVENMHTGFHSIFPAEELPLKYHSDKLKRLGKNKK